MRHHIKRSRRSKSGLILVVSFPARSDDLSVLHFEGRCCPTVVVVLGREDVVERHADAGILQSELRQTEIVREIDIGGEVAVEHHADIHGSVVVVERGVVPETGVGHVLFADVAALHGGLEAIVAEGQDVVQQEVGRESQGLVA